MLNQKMASTGREWIIEQGSSKGNTPNSDIVGKFRRRKDFILLGGRQQGMKEHLYKSSLQHTVVFDGSIVATQDFQIAPKKHEWRIPVDDLCIVGRRIG